MAELKKEDPNKKFYFNPVRKEELPEIATRAIQEEHDIIIWPPGENDKNETYKPISFDDEKKAILIDAPKGLLTKMLGSKMIDKQCCIKVGKEKFQFFTTGTLKKGEDDQLFLFFQGDIFRSIQRENFRLESGKNIKILFRYKEEDEAVPCLDVSAGGTAFVVEGSRTEEFSKGTQWSECKLQINSEVYPVPFAKVVANLDDKDAGDNPNGNRKIAVQFLKMNSEVEEELFKNINGEARADAVRKKFNFG